MAKVFRKFPVMGEERVLTAAGLITFLNGEAEVEDDKAALLSGVSDIRVRVESQSTSTSSEADATALKAAAEEEAARRAEEEKKAADEEAARKAEEEAEAARKAEEEAEAARKAEEEAKKQADESATKADSAPKATGAKRPVPPPIVKN